jgi:hypothetical protein
VPKYMEICLLPKINKSESDNTSAYSIYPGLYIFTGPGRMMRPVINLATNNNEYIGSMEQCYLHICIKPEEFVEGVSYTYMCFLLIRNNSNFLIIGYNSQGNISIWIHECYG